MKRVAVITAVCFATLMAGVLLWNFRGAAILVALSLATAAAVRPAVDRLTDRGVARSLALGLVYLVGLVLVAVMMSLVVMPLLQEVQSAADRLASFYDRGRSAWPNGSPLHGALKRHLPASADILRSLAATRPVTMAEQLLGLTRNVVDVVGGWALVLVMSIYWAASREHFERLWLSLVPARRRTRARGVWRAVDAGVGTHLRSEFAQSFVALALLCIGFRAIGLDFPTIPALAGAIFRLVPLVGLVVAGLAAFLAGWSAGAPAAIFATAYALGVLLFLEFVLAPRFFGTRSVSPMLLVLVVVALANAYGIEGMIAASPVAAAIQIVFERVIATRSATIPPQNMDDLEGRMASVRSKLSQREWEGPSEIGRVVERLAIVVRRAKRMEDLTPPPSTRLSTLGG